MGVFRTDARIKMPNQMIHDGGPSGSDLQPSCATAVSVMQRPPATIDVLACDPFQVMVALHLLEQRERYGDGVHESISLKRLGDEVGLAEFLNAFEKRVDHGILVAGLG